MKSATEKAKIALAQWRTLSHTEKVVRRNTLGAQGGFFNAVSNTPIAKEHQEYEDENGLTDGRIIDYTENERVEILLSNLSPEELEYMMRTY